MGEHHKSKFGGIVCLCVYCQNGQPHPHEGRDIPLLGSPHISVCRNCGHKQLATKETP